MVVSVLGGDPITNNGSLTISAGNSVTFQITNPGAGCSALLVQSVTSSSSDFSISPSSIASENIKTDCNNGNNKNSLKYLNFKLTANDTECGTTSGITTHVTIISNEPDFNFDFTVIRAPIISVLGGGIPPSPPTAYIIDGTTTTTATDGTYFGVVEAGASVTRTFHIMNSGSCPLEISSIESSIASPVLINNFTVATQAAIPQHIDPGEFFWINVTFTAGNTEDNTATISIVSNATSPSDTFTFNVSANVFKFDIPGPGGVTANFKLWLKATRGVVRDGSDKVSLWRDLGVNGKSAGQTATALQPTYLDNVDSNINFNPVIEFENNGGTLNQYLENVDNGFYNQDIFIVMEPDVVVSSTSPKMTIFSGTVSTFTKTNSETIPGKAQYDNDGDGVMNHEDVDDLFLSNDLTAVGLGNLHSTEQLWYNQGSSTTNPYYNLTALSSRSYNKAGIINAHNYSGTSSNGMRILYNSIDDENTATKEPTSLVFDNVGYIEDIPEATGPDIVWGTPYKIGKNAYDTHGNLNGRVAEIMTFAARVSDTDRPKIETYLAIKHGITLGASNFAGKNYVNSTGAIVWNIADVTFNYNIAGIGRDDSSDLNQKQSKSVNDANEATIGLGGLYAKNSENINEFSANLDFLVWGCNNLSYSGTSPNTVTIATGITTSLTRINRKWKIVESGGDVGNVFVGIPAAAFSGFPKSPNEEYVLIVSDNANFGDGDIIDVIPLKIDKDPYGNPIKDKYNSEIYKTWYDFEVIKYFTFGKAPKLSPTLDDGIERDTEKRSVNIAAGDYLVGETALNLNYNSFTVSAWIRNVTPSTLPRTIMAKGEKMQMRLNSNNNIEVVLDDDSTPSLTSTIELDDKKWHHITFVYESGTIYLYLDGILGCSKQNVEPPTPNFHHFSIGAICVKKYDTPNPFLGEIDEVYIWNRVLTQDQIRYLMNQETEKITGNLVNGKVLPQAITKNEVYNIPIPIPWGDLKVYYDFNAFYGSTVEGLSDDRDFLRINYLNKTKTIVDAQTAPLPYVSALDDGVWGDTATWVNGAVQNPPNSKGLDVDGEYLGTDIDWNIVETKHNIASDRNITVLGLKNKSGKITIEGTNAVEAIPGTGQSLRVTHYLELDGAIDLEGESQLLQDPGSILDQESGGYIEKDQQGTANSFNYNYWSSSVGPITAKGSATGIASTNAPFTIKGIINDGRSEPPTPPTPPPGILSILYGTSPYAADAIPGTQLTISSYWLYQFYGKDDDYNSWFPRINENSPLASGVGYTMKGSSGSVAIANQQNYVFRGKPYNGDITLELKNSDEIQRDRLIGNPYPSALDANEFILDNIKDSGGRNTEGNIFNGALYFWDHFGEVNSHNLGAYVGGYATYTLIGGVNAQSTDWRINHDNSWGDKIPERYIPVGQGFFVITAIDYKIDGVTPINGTLPEVKGGTITFKNSQRYFKREGSSSSETPNTGSVFMKNSNSKTAQLVGGNETVENYEEVDLRPKIRLLFHSPKGYNRQLLIGADENTTNNFDIGYDGLIADTGNEDMFWMIQGAKFVIQGVPNFNTDQEFPLGIKIAKAGLATIKIDAFGNIDENLSPHIKDKLTGESHNISRKPFEIDLAPGTYLDRFALTFKMQKLVAEDVVAELLIPAAAQPIIEGIHVFMNNAISELQIKNNSTEEITSVALINALGQTIKSWNSNFNIRTISLPLSTATGIYFVQINTKTGNTVKKISVE